MTRKSEYAPEGVRGHRPHPAGDHGAEGAGYGTSAGACTAGNGRNGVPGMWEEGATLG